LAFTEIYRQAAFVQR